MFFQQTIETMSQDQLSQLQSHRLQRQVRHCFDDIPFYRDAFNERGIVPEDIRSIEDIRKLPFTTKQDLRRGYPFKMFGVNRDQVVRIHSSSGTTGTATTVGYTQEDIDNWSDCFARVLYAIGGSPHDILQNCFGYGLFTGGLGVQYGATRAGCVVVPTSVGNTERQVRLLHDFQTSILCCTPSYALVIADRARAMGYDPAHDFNLRCGVMGAEPWSESLRQQIQTDFGMKVADIYGLSEVMGPGVAGECQAQHGLHVAEDQFYVEIVDPKTLEPVPDGTYGELVITTLTRQCSPLIRYRTRDITRILPGYCSCGRTFRRIDRITGRTDDMLIIRGVNVFPSQIEQVITRMDDVAPYYQIVLSNDGELDRIELQVEPVEGFAFDEVRQVEALRQRLSDALKGELGIKVRVRLVEPNSIERTAGKAHRIIEKRGQNR